MSFNEQKSTDWSNPPLSPPSLKYSQSKGDWRRLVPQEGIRPKTNLTWPSQSWRDPLNITSPKEYLRFVLEKEEEAHLRAQWLVLKARFQTLEKLRRAEWKSVSEGPLGILVHNGEQVKQLEQMTGKPTALVLAAMDKHRPKSGSDKEYERAMSQATDWLFSDAAERMLSSEDMVKYIEAESQYATTGSKDSLPTRTGPVLREMSFFRGATEVSVVEATHGSKIPCTPGSRIFYCPPEVRGGAMLEYDDESLQIHGRDSTCMEPMVEFTTEEPCIVYIAVDHRMAESGEAPDWLSAFDYEPFMQDVMVSSSEVDPGYYILYKSRPALKTSRWAIGYPYTGLAARTEFSTYRPLVVIVVKLTEEEVKAVQEKGEVHAAV